MNNSMKGDKMSEITKKFPLALNAELKKQIEESAKKNDRTLTGEIIRAIKFYLQHANTEDTYVSEPQIKSEEVSTIAKQEKVEEEKPISIGGRFGRI